MKSNIAYRHGKDFEEAMRLAGSDPYVREISAGRFIITVPHPTEDTEFVVGLREQQDTAHEFVNLGRCAVWALKLGAHAIHFKLLPPPMPIASE